MDLWMWMVLGVVAALVAFGLIVLASRAAGRVRRTRRRHEALQHRFGPEYERAVEHDGRKAGAEALEHRLSEYEDAEHPSLGPSEREAHTAEWREAQFRFVDSPERSVREAEHIIVSVMEERGYRTDDADVRAEALSVDDPQLANAYRSAHRAFLMADRGAAQVDQLQGAFLVYRELLEFLLARPQREDTVFEAAPPPERATSPV